MFAAASKSSATITWCLSTAFSIWFLGVVWGSARFAGGMRAALRLTNKIRPWRTNGHESMLRQVEHDLGCSLPPVFTSDHVELPVSVGLFRSFVILPEGLTEALSPTELRHVLLHECAHVAFRHSIGGLIERVVRLLFWPHPLVSALCRELARAREEVCDNVASQEDGAACYARTLLAVAQGVLSAPSITSSLALLGPETSLEARISGLLNPRRNRMVHVSRGKLWAVTGVVICAAATTFGVRVVAAMEHTRHGAGAFTAGNAATRLNQQFNTGGSASGSVTSTSAMNGTFETNLSPVQPTAATSRSNATSASLATISRKTHSTSHRAAATASSTAKQTSVTGSGAIGFGGGVSRGGPQGGMMGGAPQGMPGGGAAAGVGGIPQGGIGAGGAAPVGIPSGGLGGGLPQGDESGSNAIPPVGGQGAGGGADRTSRGGG